MCQVNATSICHSTAILKPYLPVVSIFYLYILWFYLGTITILFHVYSFVEKMLQICVHLNILYTAFLNKGRFFYCVMIAR